jgi:hypothetical protein
VWLYSNTAVKGVKERATTIVEWETVLNLEKGFVI